MMVSSSQEMMSEQELQWESPHDEADYRLLLFSKVFCADPGGELIGDVIGMDTPSRCGILDGGTNGNVLCS